MKFQEGDRVRYRIGTGVSDTLGTVVEVGGTTPSFLYTVRWDGVDYNEFQPVVYHAVDLVKDTSESKRLLAFVDPTDKSEDEIADEIIGQLRAEGIAVVDD